ncbi:MAG TPA: amidohydrolase family protein [Thermoanaerobaculia bacterium]|jgi:Tol biopolymer transport system component|nr:amidohydrolase family protein [Thermoanaerobaculia bacterium]
MKSKQIALLLGMTALLAAASGWAAPNEPGSGLPLKAERTLEFSTDEGTWISLDVSPDGKTVVFDLLGDLYMVPFSGGQARRLTSGSAFDAQPRYSPDGQWIAYTSDAGGSENLWIAKADGSSPRALTRDRDRGFASPSWTADGEYVLVSRGTGGVGVNEIWMYGVRGGSGVRLTSAGDQRLNGMGAVSTRDQSHLYYARRRGSFSWAPTLPLWQIVRRDQGTGEEEVITARPGSAFSPVLSHDGTKLVYGTRQNSETGLRLRDLRSGEERWLKYPIQRDDQEARSTRDVIPGYAFTPDDRELVLSYGGKIRRLDVATGEERQIPFSAAVSLELGPRLRYESRTEEGPVRAHLIQWLQPSPDGRRLAFSALGHLWTTDGEGRDPVRLTRVSDFEFQPVWSPDGTQIAFVTWSPAGGHLWKVRADGRPAPQRLTTLAGYYHDPVWTPDGARILALRGATRARLEAQDGLSEAEPEDLVAVPAGGGEPVTLAPAEGAGHPHFAAAGDRVYLSSGRGLELLHLDGGERHTLLKVTGKGMAGAPSPTVADELRVSPDGRQALALINNQLYLMDLPTSGDTLTVDVSAPPVKLRQLSELGADYFAWADGGKSVVWSLGASLFRQPAAAAAYQETAIVVEAPRNVPRGTVLLRGAAVITMRGDEVVPDADVLVAGNRIAAVGPRGEVRAPAGTTIIDVAGKYVIPGLVDIHEHWNELEVGLVNRENWPMLVDLAHGVTTTRDPQSRTIDIFLYQDLVEMGEVLGPRMYTTGPGIFSKLPLRSYDDVLQVATRYQKYYRTNMIKAYNVGDRQLRQWIIQASKEKSLMPTTEGAMDLKLNLTHALDGFSGNEHALPVVPLYKDVVELFAKSGIYYTPTLVLSYGGPLGENFFYESTDVRADPKLKHFVPPQILDSRTLRRSWYHPQEYVFPKLAEAATAIARAGGKVCVGGHGQFHGIQTHWEMWALASGGMSSLEVIRAATLNGAEAIGYDQDLGSVETGKLADLVILDRNPLDDIRNTDAVSYVMKNGNLYRANTLEQIWPARQEIADLWWWRDEPVSGPVSPVKAAQP